MDIRNPPWAQSKLHNPIVLFNQLVEPADFHWKKQKLGLCFMERKYPEPAECYLVSILMSKLLSTNPKNNNN